MGVIVSGKVYAIDDYPLQVGKNCMLSCIRDMLQFFNKNLTESEIYFICKGLRFKVNLNSKAERISDYFRYDIYEYIIENLSQFFHCGVEVQESLSHAEIKRLLTDRIPILFIMDPRVVPYNTRNLNPTGQQEIHSAVLYGFNDLTACYMVADSTIADDTGFIHCDKVTIDQAFLHNHTKGFLYFSYIDSVPIHQPNMQLVVYETIYEFLHPQKSPAFCEGVDAINYMIELLKANKFNFVELQFLIQAYFMPFFYYIDECFKFFKNVSENRTKMKLEKNKWDIFYYKHLLRYSHNSNYKIMVENFQKLFMFFVTMLDEFLYDWKQQISKENNYE